MKCFSSLRFVSGENAKNLNWHTREILLRNCCLYHRRRWRFCDKFLSSLGWHFLTLLLEGWANTIEFWAKHIFIYGSKKTLFMFFQFSSLLDILPHFFLIDFPSSWWNTPDILCFHSDSGSLISSKRRANKNDRLGKVKTFKLMKFSPGREEKEEPMPEVIARLINVKFAL